MEIWTVFAAIVAAGIAIVVVMMAAVFSIAAITGGVAIGRIAKTLRSNDSSAHAGTPHRSNPLEQPDLQPGTGVPDHVDMAMEWDI